MGMGIGIGLNTKRVMVKLVRRAEPALEGKQRMFLISEHERLRLGYEAKLRMEWSKHPTTGNQHRAVSGPESSYLQLPAAIQAVSLQDTS